MGKRRQRRRLGATLRVIFTQLGEEVVKLVRVENAQCSESFERVDAIGDERLGKGSQRRMQTGTECRDELDGIDLDDGGFGCDRLCLCHRGVRSLGKRSNRRCGTRRGPSCERRRDARSGLAARRGNENGLIEFGRIARRVISRCAVRDRRRVRILSRQTPTRRRSQRQRLWRGSNRGGRASRCGRRRQGLSDAGWWLGQTSLLLLRLVPRLPRATQEMGGAVRSFL